MLLDKIGRGTSTHDGMAIAWAVSEYLATGPARPRAVVATHYYGLAALGDMQAQVRLMRAVVEERPQRIGFPHRIEPGAADRSLPLKSRVWRACQPVCSIVPSRLRRASNRLAPISSAAWVQRRHRPVSHVPTLRSRWLRRGRFSTGTRPTGAGSTLQTRWLRHADITHYASRRRSAHP